MHMLTKRGEHSEMTKRLLDELDENELAALEANGFSKHHLHVLKKVVNMKKKLAEQMPEKKDIDYTLAYR